MLGETGILLVRHRLSPVRPRRSSGCATLVAANVGDEDRELLLGQPRHDARRPRARLRRPLAARRPTGCSRPATRRPGCGSSASAGKTDSYLGAAHGFAGCVLALGDVRGRRRDRPPLRDGRGRPGELAAAPRRPLVRNGTIRVQWCHGAPGMVTSLGDVLDEDLALAGGELTWRAGPLAKGASLCHGTAGNGYAFLTLFERTGDERWLDRARRFAVHSIAQVERARADHGMGRYSLWTGDLGTSRSTSPTASTEPGGCRFPSRAARTPRARARRCRRRPASRAASGRRRSRASN